MATADEYTQGLLSEPVKPVQASTYEADKGTVNAETDTVEHRLNAIVDSDSVNMQRAETQGKQYGQSRGLLNSTMSGQAAQAAMIDAAMPIAQQDAEMYSRQRLENQAAENTARSTNVQLETNASTSNAQNDVTLKNQALQSQTQKDIQTASDAASMERAQLAEAGSTHRQELSDAAAMLRTEFSELAATGRQELITMTEVQTTNAKLNADMIMNNTKIAANDREAFSSAFNEMSRQNDVELTKLALDPDLTEDEKNRLITSQNARFTANTELLGDLYSIPLTLDYAAFAPVTPDEVTPTPTPNQTMPTSGLYGAVREGLLSGVIRRDHESGNGAGEAL